MGAILGKGGRSQMVECIAERVRIGDFTDGAGTSGYVDLEKKVPAGSIILGWGAYVVEGFAGDTSAVIEVGDGTDADEFCGAEEASVLTAAAYIANIGDTDDANGNTMIVTAETTIRITVTGAADFTSIVTADNGILDFYLYYIQAVPRTPGVTYG